MSFDPIIKTPEYNYRGQKSADIIDGPDALFVLLGMSIVCAWGFRPFFSFYSKDFVTVRLQAKGQIQEWP